MITLEFAEDKTRSMRSHGQLAGSKRRRSPMLRCVMRRCAAAVAWAVAVPCALLAWPAYAQAPYPAKPVTLVVPFAPGGATDVVARLLAQEIARPLGQSVIVENKPGAAGALGANFVAKSLPDGYTLCVCGGGPTVILALLDPQLPYVPSRDLAPVVLSHLVDFVVAVRSDASYKSLKQLVDAAKANPGRISYGSTGAGGPAHLGMELFKKVSGADFLHVPYKGESNVTTDLLGGQIDIGLLSVQAAAPNLASNQMRAIAVWSPARIDVLRDVPTIAEQGYPDFSAGTFVGINAPAGTPGPVIDKLQAVFVSVLTKPGIRAKLSELGLTPMALGPQDYAAFLARERAKWAKVIKDIGLKGRE